MWIIYFNLMCVFSRLRYLTVSDAYFHNFRKCHESGRKALDLVLTFNWSYQQSIFQACLENTSTAHYLNCFCLHDFFDGDIFLPVDELLRTENEKYIRASNRRIYGKNGIADHGHA